jgi:hypothetical protein
MRGSLFQIIIFIGLTASRGKKAKLPLWLENAYPQPRILLPHVSVEATGVCIPTGNIEVLLAAINKSPGHAWNDAYIIELLRFRHKSILVGALNAKHRFWKSEFPSPSGAKPLDLLHINEFKISAPQCPIHYSPAGNCDALDIVFHKNVRLLEVNVSDILDSDHLPVVFNLLDYV